MALGSGPPRVFISYAWEEEPHASWVKELATRLRIEDGLDVTLDRWAAQPGDELSRFMETSVRESRFILLICTPAYKAKFDARLGGVGYEARAITGEILVGLEKGKVIPIHRAGLWKEASPTIVAERFYFDLTGDPFNETPAYSDLVDTLHGRREIAPEIGYGARVFEGPGAVPAIAVPNFSGRDEELRELLGHLRAPGEKAVCVVASGIGGVGKTALARQLVATVAPRLFPQGAAWLDGTNLAAELARVARRFGWREETDPTHQQATQFLGKHLNDRALLLVVDNLPANADVAHVPIPGGKCRTLVTSRSVSLANDLAVPAATIRIEHWPPATSRQYLREVVSRLAKEPDIDLNALSAFVGGLPLAIKLIARALLNNVDRSAKEHLDLLKAQPIGTLDKFAASPDRGVAATFLEAYCALSADEQKVLRALAACAQGTRPEIVAAVAGLGPATAKEALNALYRVSLCEFRAGATAPWGLHDVLRMFLESQSGSKDASAAHLAWVREHQRRHSDPFAHAAREEGTTEAVAAFDRLLAAREVGLASEVLYPVYEHLTLYGRYAQVVDLAERLLGSLGRGASGVASQWLGNLGNCYQTLGDIPKAIDFHQRALAIDEKLGSIEGQARHIGNLGLCHRTVGDIPKAIDFHQRALAIDEKLGRIDGQASNLGNLGNCYQTLGDIPKAIDFIQRALAIDEKLGRLGGQASHLGNLGICYRTLGDIPKAIDLHQRALTMNEKLGSLNGQARNLGNLGLCYQTLGDIPKAIDLHQRALTIAEKLGPLDGQARHLGNLGICYETLGDISKAIDVHQRALAMNEKLGRLDGQATNLGNLGLCYRTVGDIPKAIDLHQRAFAIDEKLGRLGGQASHLGNLGLCYQQLGDIPKAIDFIRRALGLFRKMEIPESHPNVVMLQEALAEAQ